MQSRVLIIPKGQYDASVTYEPLDLVYYNNDSWVAKKKNKGVLPTEGGSWYRFTAIRDGDAQFNKLTSKEIHKGNDIVQSYKVLYDNETGTYGTITLAESAENFSMLEIIVGFSDVYGNQSVKLYAPNGKVTDISATIPTSTTVTSLRTRCAISGTTITQSNNARAIVYVDATTAGSGINASNNTNKMYVKTVIGYR